MEDYLERPKGRAYLILCTSSMSSRSSEVARGCPVSGSMLPFLRNHALITSLRRPTHGAGMKFRRCYRRSTRGDSLLRIYRDVTDKVTSLVPLVDVPVRCSHWVPQRPQAQLTQELLRHFLFL